MQRTAAETKKHLMRIASHENIQDNGYNHVYEAIVADYQDDFIKPDATDADRYEILDRLYDMLRDEILPALYAMTAPL
jgi:hypothetical protein